MMITTPLNTSCLVCMKYSLRTVFGTHMVQGVSERPFLALSRAQRTSVFYPERTPHARVWFIVFFAAHRTHTYNFCKSHDGYQFKSKLVLELPNGIRFLI